jgi:MFS family permease
MQNVGAAWLMTSLTPSPVVVALVQAATSLPVFLVGLPAGALADIVDRRRLLIVSQGWMLLSAAALGVLTLIGFMSPWILLALTFALGLGAAMNTPAWQAIVPEVVSPSELQEAVALNAAGFNVARAVGPALGGLIVAAVGPGPVFLLNAASFIAVMLVVYRWNRQRAASRLTAEHVIGAMRAGIRYVRNAPSLQAVLVRSGVLIVCAAGLWALLPLVARDQLGLGATGYGVLLGCLGIGAVTGATLLPRIKRKFSLDMLVTGATVVFAVATAALAYVQMFSWSAQLWWPAALLGSRSCPASTPQLKPRPRNGSEPAPWRFTLSYFRVAWPLEASFGVRLLLEWGSERLCWLRSSA